VDCLARQVTTISRLLTAARRPLATRRELIDRNHNKWFSFPLFPADSLRPHEAQQAPQVSAVPLRLLLGLFLLATFVSAKLSTGRAG